MLINWPLKEAGSFEHRHVNLVSSSGSVLYCHIENHETPLYLQDVLKIYFGGGGHFLNWLEECKESGEVSAQDVKSTGYKSFKEGGKKLYRI